MLEWFITSKIGRSILGAAAILAVVGGFYLWAEGNGEDAVTAKDATAVQKEMEDARKLREGNDVGARNMDNERALVCLHHPEGCRR